MSYGR